MKKTKMILIALLLLAALITFYSIKWLIDSAPYLKAIISNDYETATMTVLNIDENDIVSASYLVNDEEVIGTFKNDTITAQKVGQELEMKYIKSNPEKIIKLDSIIVGYVFLLIILWSLIYQTPIFIDIIAKRKIKNWDLKMCDLVDTKVLNEFWVEINFSFEQDGKKKIESVFCNSAIVKALINDGIINKVPIRFNPKNNKKFMLDVGYIEEKVSINKALVQLD